MLYTLHVYALNCLIEDDVKAKIKSLRSTYGRERKKKKVKKTGTGMDDTSTKTWRFFESLRFLDDFTIPKSSQSNIVKVSDQLYTCINKSNL